MKIDSIQNLNPNQLYEPQKSEENIKQINQVDNKKEELDKEQEDKIKEKLQKVVEELNKAMQPLNEDLKFKFNDKVDNLVVQVVDKKNDKIIREFPPKEALELMERMRELVGILFNQKG